MQYKKSITVRLYVNILLELQYFIYINNMYIDFFIVILGIERYHTYLFILIYSRENIELNMIDFVVMKLTLNLHYKR